MTRTDTHRVVWGADPADLPAAAAVSLAEIDAADACADRTMAAWDAPTRPEIDPDEALSGMRVACMTVGAAIVGVVGLIILGLALGGAL